MNFWVSKISKISKKLGGVCKNYWNYLSLMNFIMCAPKSMEYISENLDKIVKGKEIEFFENFTDVTYAHDTCADEMISFLKQAVEKLQENTAADC